MTVCLDTNTVLQMGSARRRFGPLLHALNDGKIRWAISNEVLLEYEEILVEHGSSLHAEAILRLIEAISHRCETIVFIEPHFRFRVVTADPDDNKFTDCAIAADADFLITEDAHFAPLATAGYKPQPITPDEFIARFLAQP